MQDINEIKSKIYTQKCAEKLKIKNINQMKDKIYKTEMKNLETAEKIEKILTKQKKGNKINIQKASIRTTSNKEIIEPTENTEKNRENYEKRKYGIETNNNEKNNTKEIRGENNNAIIDYNAINIYDSNQSNRDNFNHFEDHRKDLLLDIVDNTEQNIKLYNNINLNSPLSLINQNLSNNNVNSNNFLQDINDGKQLLKF